MKIAILGATSQIAKDLTISFAKHADYQCMLFSRHPEEVRVWLQGLSNNCDYSSEAYHDFEQGHYDVIINFVGVGDPGRAKEMGSKIFGITHQYDQMALDYIQQNTDCKYIFLSSGAVYGDVFSVPASEISVARIPVNQLGETYWYTIAKLYAEARHRSLSELPIVDVRVFNYFSHTQDMLARFLITDMVRAMQEKRVFKTSSDEIVRDYISPPDFYGLIHAIIAAPNANMPVDCYSKEPIGKLNLLIGVAQKFGLEYELVKAIEIVNATGSKLNYYSKNRAAEVFGYEPKGTSIDNILAEIALIKNAK